MPGTGALDASVDRLEAEVPAEVTPEVATEITAEVPGAVIGGGVVRRSVVGGRVDGGRVGIPGDRARALRRERLAQGIPLDARLWQDLLGLATEQTR